MKIRKINPAFTDERGSISDLFYKEQIDHVAVIKTNEGNIIRGNHYHKQTTQHIYMSRGKLRYWYKSLDPESSVDSLVIPQGHIVSTPPCEVHALEMMGASEFIVFSKGLRGGIDYESDTFREHVILTPDMLENAI